MYIPQVAQVLQKRSRSRNHLSRLERIYPWT